MTSLVPRQGRRWASLAVAITLMLPPCLASARTVYVTPHGEPGFPEGAATTVPAIPWNDAALTGLQAGDVVQLLPTSADPASVTTFSGRVQIRSVRALSAPVVVRGMARRTRIVGSAIDALRCPMPDDDVRGCKGDGRKSPEEEAATVALNAVLGRPRDLLAVLVDEAPRSRPLPGDLLDPVILGINPFPAPSKPSRLARAACIDLQGVEGIVIERIDFRECWLSAVRTRASRHVTLRDAFVVGSSYGVAVRGKEPWEGAEEEASHITVERVTWIQDASGYGTGDPARNECLPERRRGDLCVGDLWRRIPWGSAHHGAFEHLNGALLGGRNVTGDVVFRDNVVANAYNGIRLTARPCSKSLAAGQPNRTSCPYNDRVVVERNRFALIRDNPVEFEDWATNAFVIGNRFRNAHAWLSFDGMGGGPVYAYGNVGWFDDRPSLAWSDELRAQACVRNETVERNQPYRFDPNFDRRFDYVEGQWLKIGEEEPGALGQASEMRCETGTLGRVLKFALPEKGAKRGTYNYPRLGPVHVFNNSWFLRAPITGIGAPANLRHWNNAFLFCQPGVAGFDERLCDPMLPADPADCGAYARDDPGLGRYPARTGSIPFFECFRWMPFDEGGQDVAGLDSRFDWDVSGNGFPVAPTLPASFEAHGRQADPAFVAPHRGDFTLREGSAARQSGCLVEWTGRELACRSVEPGNSFAGAVSPSGLAYGGPPGLPVPR